MNFVGIVGTNASFSYNRKLLWYMKKHFSEKASIEIQEIADIPLFSEDIKELPLRVREIAHAIEAADGVVFATPEYDHSISAALKSLVEWLSWGDLHPLTNTPVMIVGVSLGNMGTVFAQENLRQILSSPGLDAFVLPSNQFLLGHAATSFDEADELVDERTVGWLEHCFASFIAYTEATRTLRRAGTDHTKTEKTEQESISHSHKPLLEEGNGWCLEDISLLPQRTDADTGSSKHENNTEIIKPAEGTPLVEKGEGWWIEIVALTDDAATGSSKHGVDAETGASKRKESKVAAAVGQPDTSTGASKH